MVVLTQSDDADRFSSIALAREEVRHEALYNNRLCNVVEMSTDITLADQTGQFVVSLGDESLVIDPTDQQVADADNLRESYGLDAEAVDRFRDLLRGDWFGHGVG